MPTIASATITAFYLFDVAEQIDLNTLRASIGGGASSARLTTKAFAPSYLQCSTPPVVVEGESIDVLDVDGLRLRVKFLEYGVVSLVLNAAVAGEWPELIALGQIYLENDDGTRTVVADGLDFPTGVAVGDRVFYVTNHGTSPGIGEVLRFRH